MLCSLFLPAQTTLRMFSSTPREVTQASAALLATRTISEEDEVEGRSKKGPRPKASSLLVIPSFQKGPQWRPIAAASGRAGGIKLDVISAEHVGACYAPCCSPAQTTLRMFSSTPREVTQASAALLATRTISEEDEVEGRSKKGPRPKASSLLVIPSFQKGPQWRSIAAASGRAGGIKLDVISAEHVGACYVASPRKQLSACFRARLEKSHKLQLPSWQHEPFLRKTRSKAVARRGRGPKQVASSSSHPSRKVRSGGQ